MRIATGSLPPWASIMRPGRLTLGEFKERLDAAHAAKTLGQLDDLMADLPGADLPQQRRDKRLARCILRRPPAAAIRAACPLIVARRAPDAWAAG
jgi:hypothetical protein